MHQDLDPTGRRNFNSYASYMCSFASGGITSCEQRLHALILDYGFNISSLRSSLIDFYTTPPRAFRSQIQFGPHAVRLNVSSAREARIYSILLIFIIHNG